MSKQHQKPQSPRPQVHQPDSTKADQPNAPQQTDPRLLSPGNIMRLQGAVGNQAVQRLISGEGRTTTTKSGLFVPLRPQVITPVLQRETTLAEKQETANYSRAAAALGTAAAIGYEKYVRAVDALKADIKKVAKDRITPPAYITFVTDMVSKFIPKPIKTAATVAKKTSDIVGIKLPNVEEAMIESMTKDQIDFVKRLLQERDTVASTIVRNAPGPTAERSYDQAAAEIDAITANLNKTEMEDYKVELRAALDKYIANYLDVGGQYTPDGADPDAYMKKIGVNEVHWIDVDNTGDSKKIYLAQVSNHRKRMGPMGCHEWNYHFIRWVSPDYAMDALARGSRAGQDEYYMKWLHQPTANLTLSPQQPFVSNHYIGNDTRLLGKTLNEALGDLAGQVDPRHELKDVVKPIKGQAFSLAEVGDWYH